MGHMLMGLQKQATAHIRQESIPSAFVTKTSTISATIFLDTDTVVSDWMPTLVAQAWVVTHQESIRAINPRFSFPTNIIMEGQANNLCPSLHNLTVYVQICQFSPSGSRHGIREFLSSDDDSLFLYLCSQHNAYKLNSSIL